ncbi:hypothetical protein [Hymenobacter psoromatis]|uniref:hypothetical protein n=1 Tax=Hymenobacter psoromatis TaxID=1484116 RepID=UPI001CBE5237|nr:hypothetical protein [Hymenobacter psoromatis]
MSYQRTAFSEIKHLLPPDAWAAWRNDLHKGEFEAESVLVFENSTELEELNLDAPFDEVEHVFLILVKGNLTIQRFVYNEDTDGATGLIVLGDLQAATMLVGGQEIYITGNLLVSELFWGDYNHGDLRVLGNATAGVFVETDQYSVSIAQRVTIGTHLTPYREDGNWRGLDADLARKLLVDELVNVEDDEIVLVRDEAILSRLQAGQSLLKSRPTQLD